MSPAIADDTDEYFDMDLDDSLLVGLISPEALDRGKGKRPAEDLPTPFAKRSAVGCGHCRVDPAQGDRPLNPLI
jgi:hypothetical protein